MESSEKISEHNESDLTASTKIELTDLSTEIKNGYSETEGEINEGTTGDEGENNLLSKEKINGKMDTFHVSTDDLKGGPFDIDNHMIPLTYDNLLGEGQAQSILKMNGLSHKTPSSLLEKGDSLNIPLVYPELRSEFQPSFSDFMNKHKGFQEYKDEIAENNIVVTKCANGKNALAYYKGGKLKMATYVSIGKINTKTISGIYSLGDRILKKRSKKYHNSAMPYAINIINGYFLHQGASNGSPRSHGCVRIPGLYERWLYQEMKDDVKANTKIILNNMY